MEKREGNMEVKIGVSKRSMMQRLRRQLAKDNQSLRRSRSYSEKSNFGDYYILDTRKNTVIVFHLTEDEIEEMARESGAVKPDEEILA